MSKCQECGGKTQCGVRFWDGYRTLCDICYGKWLEEQNDDWPEVSAEFSIVFRTVEPVTRREVIDAIKEAFEIAVDDCVECAKCDNEDENDPGPWLQKLERLGNVRIVEDE